MMHPAIRKDLEDLAPYTTNDKNLPFRLHANESPWDWLKEFPEELKAIFETTAFNHYPDGCALPLREILGEYCGADSSEIVLGSGSDELIKMAAEIFLSPGDAIVIHTPTFSEYTVAARICSAQVFEVPSKPDFSTDIDGLIQKANAVKAKMVFVCTPNNPTGAVVRPEDVMRVLDETQAMVVCDEAYYEFCGETMAQEARRNDRLIVLRTLSKAFGMAGLRVGYAICTALTADCLNRVRMPYNISSVTQALAILALENRQKVARMLGVLESQRKRVYDEAAAIEGLEVFWGGANFLLYRTPAIDGLIAKLEDSGVMARRFRQESLKNCIRINIGTPEANTKVLDALREVDHAKV